MFGEVYEVDDRLLKHLDWIEAHPTMYTRIPIQCVMSETQALMDCEVYIVFGFRPELLSLPHLSSYDSVKLDQDKKYRFRDEREKGYSLASEVKKDN